MSGIAEVLHNMGFTVSGSDLAEGETVNRLRRLGIEVHLGHQAEHVAGAETLVFSTAVSKDNVEVQAALDRRIPVIPRAEMLAELMRMKLSVAVAGTHGKTSTTSMVATILTSAGMDPTYVVGGRLKVEESGAKLGKSEYLVAEADESDGSFLRLFPTIGVITNVEDDHLDHYGDMAHLEDAFVGFANKVPFYGAVVACDESPVLRKLFPRINKRLLRYGFSPDADIVAKDCHHALFGASFTPSVGGEDWPRVSLNVGGTHNILNALAAIGVAWELGVDPEAVVAGLSQFYPPERRMQVLHFDGGRLVVDDYAHHPTEVAAVLRTLREGGFRRLLAVFQPHRYTRLQNLMEPFARVLSEADVLWVAPVYPAGQTPIPGVDAAALAQVVRQIRPDMPVEAGLEGGALLDAVREVFREGDVLAFLSAGNLTHEAHRFAQQIKENG